MRKTLVLLIMVLALVATGCIIANPTAHVTGGGFIEGSRVHEDVTGDFFEGDTANFGFNVKCEGDDGAKGHLTYHDGDLKIKATIDDCEYSCGELRVMGDWVRQGRNALDEGGRFTITGEDDGEPGIGDFFTIELEGSFDYYNEGDLLGGNIQEHEDD